MFPMLETTYPTKVKNAQGIVTSSRRHSVIFEIITNFFCSFGEHRHVLYIQLNLEMKQVC